MCPMRMLVLGVTGWLLFCRRPNTEMLLQAQAIQRDFSGRDHQDWLRCGWINMKQVDNVAGRISHIHERWPISNARNENRPDVRGLGGTVRKQGPWYIDHASMDVFCANRQIDNDFGLLAGKPSLMKSLVMWERRPSLKVLAQSVPNRCGVWPLKKRNDESQLVFH